MYKEFYSHMQSTELPIFALVLFISVFLMMLARTFGRLKKSDFDGVAALPLLHDDATPTVKRGDVP